MASSLRDELASLKIERPGRSPVERPRRGPREPSLGAEYRRRGGGALRLLSWALWLIPLGIIGGAGFYGYKQYDQIRAKPEVTVGLVQKMTTGEAEKLLTAKGYLKSQKQAMIGTKVAGRVDQMLVKEHDHVEGGALLAVIEHHDLDAMIEQREASLERARAELEEAKAEGWQKEREEQRAERLLSKHMVPQEDFDKAKASNAMTQAKIKGLGASIRVMEANIKEMKSTLRYQMEIRAPFSGTVVEKQGEVGEIISPMAMSSSLGRSAVVTIADLQHMDVETDISENLMSRIELGQPAEVSVSANPSRRYQGRLRQIIPMGDRTRGTVKVKVEITDPDDKLFPELAATVHFLPFKAGEQSEANKSFVFVSKSAVFQENGHDYVWVVDRKSRVARRPVEVATTREDLARVETGLEPGENVVLNPTKALKDNEAVRIAE
ncbi:Macrolide export protein MacA [Aquisphaera giovannonii]|uniref:Macrolide export protein MacA n=1 Tax=Aquisphaera giovannonii TaxID=406548 RepID=A0A5B9W9U8_9BACT|nr:efflux RND transporter periplasmic adaptor subunit [Aquisphaera giovannonii]QEH37408.1 Macrolide export protein MacA [Aquisphaera giovannonii]